MRNIFCVLIIVGAIVPGCKRSSGPITKASDYEQFMCFASADSTPSFQRIQTDIDFWMKKLKDNPGDAVAKTSLGGLYGARFKTGGNINDIHFSDSLYLVANSLFKTSTSSVYRSLAANCITQHKFQQAKLYLDSALALGDDKYLTHLMRCDVFMELGYPDLAEQSLRHIPGKNNFDYLVREAKFLDHEGDIDGAIRKMELAKEKALASKKDALILWATSNLGDMYGHANRFREAYRCYLDVLQMKPDYLYALKGIAWLAFSHDKNTIDAKRILKYLSAIHPVPDYDFMLAEIAAYEKNNATKQELQNRFIGKVRDTRYGDMYNKYVYGLMVEEWKDYDKALQIAKKEVTSRPTSQSYDLLAWAYFNMGNKDDALRIAKTYVENRTYEPDALYHLGRIYAETGNAKKARQYLALANDSGFELGPDLAARIDNELKGIE